MGGEWPGVMHWWCVVLFPGNLYVGSLGLEATPMLMWLGALSHDDLTTWPWEFMSQESRHHRSPESPHCPALIHSLISLSDSY